MSTTVEEKSVEEKAKEARLLIQEVKAEIYREYGGHGSITKAAEELDIHRATLTNAFGATKYLVDIGKHIDERRS